MSEAVVPTFLSAGDWFLEIAGRDEVAAKWSDKSALSGYTIGGIVGHVGAAVAWLGPLLETAPSSDVPVMRLGDYYAPLVVRKPGDFDGELHTAARAQGERGSQRGPSETVARLRTRIDSLRQQLENDIDRLVDLRPTLPGAIQLGDFLRTRVVELVVHGDDLGVSIGLNLSPPRDAAVIAIETLLATALKEHGDLEIIRALVRVERSIGQVIPIL
jgi:uncharacterized protein (TIGR03083 family)